jgi:hypothetical protein
MTKLIVEDIKTDNPNRFKNINSPSPSPARLQALVAIKNTMKEVLLRDLC